MAQCNPPMGSYVGGLAGISRGSIHDSWARCALSGGDFIGGAAGCGREVVNCTTMVEITAGDSCLGALCGSVANEDTKLEGTHIVSESLGAVDGVSYAAQVTPTTFEEVAADISAPPEQFAQLLLTFTADGKTLAVIPFRYGEGISELPTLPAKDGCVAQWPDLDYSHLTYSQYGSGGHEIGKILSDMLAIPCYDKLVLGGVVKHSGLDEEILKQADELHHEAGKPQREKGYGAHAEN